MDIYKFLNSKDVANYLKSIDYKFSVMECAVLVCHSHTTSIKQKIEAWKEIIATMHDCAVPPDDNYEIEPSLHKLLQACIDDALLMQKEFYKEGKFAYTYRFREEMLPFDEWSDCQEIFSSFAALNEDVKKGGGTLVKNYGKPNEKTKIIPIIRYWVRKQEVEGNGDTMFADFYKGKMIYCTRCWKDSPIDMLKQIDIDIPTPFKCGDVLTLKEHYGGYDSEFVLYAMPNWTKEDYLANGINYDRDIDSPDTTIDVGQDDYARVYGYFVSNEGEVYHQHPDPYFDFEYYKGELDGRLAVLKPISDYLKGGKSLEYLLNRYVYEMSAFQNARRKEYAGVKD